MLFNSIEFLIFLPIVFCLFWIIPKKYRWVILLIASYVFYMWWNWKLVFLILFTTLISYLCGIFLTKYNQKIAIKRLVLILGIVLCFGVLIFFKYFNFLADVYVDIANLFNANMSRGHLNILLPVGISFYTFQTASYIIDVYKGKFEAEKHFGYYALFVVFFPQLVAGPIERPQDLLPQLKSDKHISEIDYSGAARIMLVGFFKKIAIADVIGMAVNNVYNDVGSANGLSIMVASFLFAFQILCDFSGYSDIAVGCAKLFGVNLTENFNEPYKSTSIKDFWGRWHISLSRWLRDYIYIPLGGSRRSKVRWVINVLIVFLISGIWHGANYTFIVWGLLHGLLQVIGVLTLSYRNKAWQYLKVNPDGKLVRTIRIVITFILVDFCWIFFRANNISDAGISIAKLFTDWSFTSEYFAASVDTLGFTWFYFVYCVIILLSLIIINKIKNLHFNKINFFKTFPVRYITYLTVAVCVICSWVYLQSADVGSSFIYFQF